MATFFCITKEVLTSGSIVKIDLVLANTLYNYRSPAIAEFFLAVTFFGGALFVLTSAAFFSIYCLVKKHLEYLALLVTLSGTVATVSILKALVNRSRPSEDIAYYIEEAQSFPSGHASISVALYGYLVYFLLRTNTSLKMRTVLMTTGTLIIILIGFSRLYLDVHYLSDVLGGYLIGTLWLIIGIITTEVIIYRRNIKS